MHTMAAQAERLRQAREAAGFETAADAARAFGWNTNTYKSHENGVRGMSKKAAYKYAGAFGVGAGWLLIGEGRGPGGGSDAEIDRRMRQAVARAAEAPRPAETLDRRILAVAVATSLDRRRENGSLSDMSGADFAADVLNTYDIMLEAARFAGR